MKLALVGAGKMGNAVIRGAIRAGLLQPEDVGVYHPDPNRRATLAAIHSAVPVDLDAVQAAERVLIAVKPQSFLQVAPTIARAGGSFISLMAGVTTGRMASRLASKRVVRAMPNLGASVGASATALAWHPEAPQGDQDFARALFEAVGNVYEVPESLFDAATGLAASGPAFVALFAEALADAGVRVGFGRDLARELSRQVLVASAKLLEAKHAGELKDEVASAGGTAIAGIRAMERHRVRFAVMDAIEEATARANALSGSDDSN